ncbi:hypothetical protein SDC9_113833 [bioreactor metagenome]|uniref:Uncharacterized protein n=1 Tax=bioreactor metagenome TaxID=1076179 RepID=A0A645BN76_9ZZZZ
MLREMLADHAGEGQAQIGINVDLAYGHGRGLAQHGFRHALRAVHLAAVLVDHGNILGDDAGSAVQHDGEAGQPAADILQDVKAQLGLAFELERAVAGADGNRQAVAAGLGDKLFHILGAGIA